MKNKLKLIGLAAFASLAFTLHAAAQVFFGGDLHIPTDSITNTLPMTLGTMGKPTGYGQIYHSGLLTTNDLKFYALIQLSSANTIEIGGTNYLVAWSWNPTVTNDMTETIVPATGWNSPDIDMIASFTNTSANTIIVNGSFTGTIK